MVILTNIVFYSPKEMHGEFDVTLCVVSEVTQAHDRKRAIQQEHQHAQRCVIK